MAKAKEVSKVAINADLHNFHFDFHVNLLLGKFVILFLPTGPRRSSLTAAADGYASRYFQLVSHLLQNAVVKTLRLLSFSPKVTSDKGCWVINVNASPVLHHFCRGAHDLTL